VGLSLGFADRRDAGRRLAELLRDCRGDETIVYGIPRGGVVVADAVASALGSPLEVLIVRKLGYPGHEEAGFGAVGEGGVVAPEALADMRPEDRGYDMVSEAIARRRSEVEQRTVLFRGERPRARASGMTAVVVDDGVATGYTFAAALAIVREDQPRRLIGAIPVAAAEGVELAARYCDEVRVLGTAPAGAFFAVSTYYDTFSQVTDEQVVELLARAPDTPA
jgi:putative phosphoribosyl transferase